MFGLLGVNGAGKSSTFKCMVGDEPISGGQITLGNLKIGDVYQKPWLLHGIVGYCPQFDCIEPELTVEEHLTLIARLCGYRENDISLSIMTVIFKIGLKMFVKTRASNLSGGNKRKLCLAMALLGRPQILYTDEASAGVAPASRRMMWNTIKDEGSTSAVVITTHAMEEAEALSHNIGIMVSGKFKCYGTL